MLERVAAVISPFASTQICLWKMYSCQWKKSRSKYKKIFSFIYKYVNEELTLPCLREDHSATNSINSQSIQHYLVPFPADEDCKCIKAVNSLGAVSR